VNLASVQALRIALWASGFRPVPVLTDTKVPLGYSPPGTVNYVKLAAGASPPPSWPDLARTDPPWCVTHPAVEEATNTGILCDGLRPFDLDDPVSAEECCRAILDILGQAPIRTRLGSPRCLLLYRAAEGSPRYRETCRKVEVLGHGWQFVAFGRHPCGADLEWSPPIGRHADLVAVTEDQVSDALAACTRIICGPPQN
jgi:hypothetical protein